MINDPICVVRTLKTSNIKKRQSQRIKIYPNISKSAIKDNDQAWTYSSRVEQKLIEP